MQREHKDENQNEVTDMLAMAICMQLTEEFNHMMKRLKISTRPLTIETYKYYQSYMLGQVMQDRREQNLYGHIINTYAKYAEILKSRKSYMEGIDQDG